MKKGLKLEDIFGPDDLEDVSCELDLLYRFQPMLKKLFEDWLKRRKPKKKPPFFSREAREARKRKVFYD